MTDAETRYRIACTEFSRLRKLLDRNQIKSTGDWKRLQSAREHKAACQAVLDAERSERVG